MTIDDVSHLPVVSESQRIGRLANKAFTANCPNAWLCDSVDGDNDFGLDYQVQVETDGLIKDCFRLQLKGKTDPVLNAGGAEFSVSIKLSTVNYYARFTEPILLVLCDLSFDIDHPKDCPLYYTWIHDDLRRIREHGIKEGQSSVTFHIPTSNLLTETTDLTSDLEKFRRLAKVGEQLDIVLQNDCPSMQSKERSELIMRAAKGLGQRSPFLLEALAQDQSSSWVEAPKGSLHYYLKESMAALASGEIDAASLALEAANQIAQSSKPIERADYWHAVGRLQSHLLDDREAMAAYDQACTLTQDSPKHLVPWAEAKLRSSFSIDGKNDFTAVIARLSSPEPAVAGMRARLLAAEGRYSEATEIAKEIPGVDGNFARAIIFAMQAKTKELISEADIGLALPGIPEKSKLAFLVLRARGWFMRSLENSPLAGAYEELPMTGPSGANPTFLHLAWKDILQAVKILKAANWPSNTEMIADIWAASAAMLGQHQTALPLMAEAAAKRPSMTAIQESVESIAAQVEEFGIALEANARQPRSEKQLLRRIALLHLANRHRDCVELFRSQERLIQPTHAMYGFAVGMAIDSADRIVQPTIAKEWMDKLEGIPGQEANLAVIQFIRAIKDNPLCKEAAILELEEKFQALQQPQTIALQLFQAYDACESVEANKCVEVAKIINKERLLDVNGTLHLAQALVTLKRWDDLLALSDQSGSRFQTEDRITAIGAIALDHLGRSAEAYERLHRIITSPETDSFALNAYIAISSRSGFTDEAVNCIERVLAAEPKPSKRLECLKHLFALLHLSDPNSPRLIEVAWRMGSCADPTNEVEEGLFLMAMFAATLPADTPIDEQRKSEVQRRLEEFIQRFPNSKTLKRVSLPNDATAEQFIQKLREISGITDEQLRWRAIMQDQLRRGSASIPYAWRPRNIIDGISDLPTLWGISKRSSWEDRQLHLTMVQDGWEALPLRRLREVTPILDLIALLVVHDLGLMDHIFKFFTRIAISKNTLVEIQQLLSPMSACPFRGKIKGLQDDLKKHFHSIEQPNIEQPIETHNSPIPWYTEEISNLAKSGKYFLYSDDLLFRYSVFAESAMTESMCTLDLLHGLDESGILATDCVAQNIATLATWRVGLLVTIRYQIAILPDELSQTRSISEGVTLLQSDPLCNGLFTCLWDHRKKFPDLIGHAGAILRELSSNAASRADSVSAFVAFWLNKVRLHKKAPSSPEQILAYLIIQAMSFPNPLNTDVAHRIWNVYQSIIEFIHGNTMDDKKYRSAIELAGRVAALADHKLNPPPDRSMQRRISSAMVEGTSDSDCFLSAYSRERFRIKSEEMTQAPEATNQQIHD